MSVSQPESYQYLIINGDDFGYSPDINRAIVECFESGLISSATIMANMPGFDHAVQLIDHHRLHDNIGIHLNFTEGLPITRDMSESATFCDTSGQLFRRRHFHLSRRDSDILAAEARAQIDRCRDAGLKLTHADSHHHCHSDPAVFRAIAPVLRETNIPLVRVLRNAGDAACLSAKGAYKWFLNWQISRMGWRRTDYYGEISDFLGQDPKKIPSRTSIEIAVHPCYDRQGNLVDKVEGWQLDTSLRKLASNRQLGPYSLAGSSR